MLSQPLNTPIISLMLTPIVLKRLWTGIGLFLIMFTFLSFSVLSLSMDLTFKRGYSLGLHSFSLNR